jgi:hypothetical protein
VNEENETDENKTEEELVRNIKTEVLPTLLCHYKEIKVFVWY